MNSFNLRLNLCALVLLLACGADAQSVRVRYIDNSLATGAIDPQPVKDFLQPANGTDDVADGGALNVLTAKRHQTMVGVGAAFSEIGSLAFLSLPADQQSAVVKSLFDPGDAAGGGGAGFAICRLPVGASDFAASAYSYDDKPGDYAMDAFTLERDEKSMIPVVRRALAVNPSLMLFASPWSPPGWMKPTGRMDHDGKENNHLIDDPKIYQAYALYFRKYLQGYLADGIFISRLCPQNEMDCNPGYPGCVMPPEQMTKLVGQYLAPELKSAGVKTEIWPGTFRETSKVPWAMECLKDDAFRAAAVGLGVQYCSGKSVGAIAAAYPTLRFMFTEAGCEDGKNTVRQARIRMGEMINAFAMGCDSYAYWNMMLDENQKSGWGWKQNSLITIDRATHAVRYNPDFQPVCLVSHAVRPGDARIESAYQPGKAVRLQVSAAFVRPDGSVTVLTQNINDSAVKISIDIDSAKTVAVTLPPHSDAAISVGTR
jgi:glucosylceramidase